MQRPIQITPVPGGRCQQEVTRMFQLIERVHPAAGKAS
ncbi:hypothetical protein J2S58_003723 [Nakamurella flavida]|nr:hypothetical protein [Nakamurella flavida]